MEKFVKNEAEVKPGTVWRATDGHPIQAHGGGILYHEGVYYWYGQNMDGATENGKVDSVDVSCYSSIDLCHWKNEGVVLHAVKDDGNHDLNPKMVVERPKVIYNDFTGKFVMWIHIDSADYSYARAGVAISEKAVGPFEYIESFRPNGEESRDMTLFKDSDGKAYHIYSSENNSTMYFSLLSEDYLKPAGKFTRNFIGEKREAPAVFKHNGKYFIITSGCTWWDPNEAEYAISDNIFGPWKVVGNPCVGKDAEKTFHSQSTHVFPVEGKPGTYIFMADRWKEEDLSDSRYIWLPFKVENDKIQIRWQTYWNFTDLK